MADEIVGWAIESTGHILRTTNGGAIWQDAIPPNGHYREGGFFALDANTAWATSWTEEEIQNVSPKEGSAIVWRTSDGGLRWESSTPFSIDQDTRGKDVPVEYYHPITLQFVDAKNGWLLVDVYYNMHHQRLFCFGRQMAVQVGRSSTIIITI